MRWYMKNIVYDAIYIFINYIVSYIPLWTIRKIFLSLFGMKIGKNSRINMGCMIFEPWHIRIGTGTTINEHCILDGRGQLEIGNNCSISMYSIIYSASHKSNSESFEYYERRTIIRDGAWIGARAVILPGAILNDYCIIGANGVVPRGEYNEKSIYIGLPVHFWRERHVMKINDLRNDSFFR